MTDSAAASSVGEAAKASWATAQPTSPSSIVGRRPHRSASTPPASRDGIEATPNDATTRPAVVTDVPKSSTRIAAVKGSAKAPSRLTARAATSARTGRGSGVNELVTGVCAIVSHHAVTVRRQE